MNLAASLPLASLWTQASRPAAWVVLDMREEPGHGAMVFRRAWAPGGFCVRPLRLPRTRAGEVLARLGCPVQVLFRRQQPPPREILDALYLEVDELRALDEADLAALPVPPAEAAPRVRLRIQGRREVHLAGDHLPLRCTVTLSPGRPGAPLLGISGEDRDVLLPAPAWFLLEATEGVSSRELLLDVVPGLDGDRWSLACPGGGLGATALHRPLAPAGPRGLPRHLGVVLDRTCAQRKGLDEARERSLDEDRDSPESNRELRDGLADGLAEVLGAGPCHITLWSVADPEDAQEVEGAVRRHGPLPAGRAGELAEDAGWVPGVELFHPLDHALAEAISSLEVHGDHAAVLVVGDSPPRLPLQPESPLTRLGRLGGVQVSTRARTGHWRRALARARRADIPVAYLFLSQLDEDDAPWEVRGGPPEPWPEDPSARRARLEGELCAALGESLPVFLQTAEAAGVDAGVRAWLEDVARRPSQRSSLEVAP